MSNQVPSSCETAERLLGDTHVLAGQLGSPDGLASLNLPVPGSAFHHVTDLPSLRRFLRAYQSHVLIPCEWPAIVKAHRHCGRGEVRELIALDQELVESIPDPRFAAASQRVGKAQLKKLRPLRDQRVVQRYLRAVEAGEAHAWHTLVYGLILSLYSLPLRQGLLGYAYQTTNGFIHAATPGLKLSEGDCSTLLAEACRGLSASMEPLLPNSLPTASSCA